MSKETMDSAYVGNRHSVERSGQLPQGLADAIGSLREYSAAPDEAYATGVVWHTVKVLQGMGSDMAGLAAAIGELRTASMAGDAIRALEVVRHAVNVLQDMKHDGVMDGDPQLQDRHDKLASENRELAEQLQRADAELQRAKQGAPATRVAGSPEILEGLPTYAYQPMGHSGGTGDVVPPSDWRREFWLTVYQAKMHGPDADTCATIADRALAAAVERFPG